MSTSIVGERRNIQVLRGLATNKSLLSCGSDGNVVDLWYEDDNSGRQEWNITLVPGFQSEVFNITVVGGVSNEKKFLSCGSDGLKVDLWNEDDGSGRQRWSIQSVQGSNIPNYYYIRIIGGVNGGRSYLSCTADGLKVDLYDKDDNSGRQRWQLQ